MPSRVDLLQACFDEHVRLPWSSTLAGPQRVWFAVYDKADERRVRHRLTDFELAATRSGHPWHLVDLTHAPARWIAADGLRESYFARPDRINRVLPELMEHVVKEIRTAAKVAGPDSIVALLGVGSLFGFLKVADLVKQVAPEIPGRLLVFFPGSVENNVFKLLDARDGWDYLAVVLTAGPSLGAAR